MATLKVDIVSDLKAKGFDQAEKSLGGLEKAATIAAAAVGAALVVGAKKAIDAASNLAESTNAVQQVFGDASKTITDFASTAAKSTGLSARAFQELATSTGALLGNMGYDAQEAADSTLILGQRAADMASVFNTDVSQALEAINAGLRGQSEPLRTYGVQLSDAAVKAKAVEMGLYSGTGALDANAKAQAAVALVLEQTNKLQGDFVATSDGAANAQRVLGAQVEDLQAQLGEALLPAMELVLKALSSLAGLAQDNAGAVQALIVVLAAAAAGILAMKAATAATAAVQTAMKVATVAWTAAQWLLNAALTANPIGIVVVAIGALIAGLVLAYNKSDAFRNIVDAVANILKNTLGLYLKLVIDYYTTLWKIIQTVADVLYGALSYALRTAAGYFSNLLEPIKRALDYLGKLKDLAGSVGGFLGKLNPFAAEGYSAVPALTPLAAAHAGYAGGTSRSLSTLGRGAPITVVIEGSLSGSPLVAGRRVAAVLDRYRVNNPGGDW